jgi:hypothetical protein
MFTSYDIINLPLELSCLIKPFHERAHRFGGEFTRSEIFGAVFIADGRDEVLTATRENLRAGASQIKVMAGGGAASPYDPLDVTQYTLDELKAADDWGLMSPSMHIPPKPCDGQSKPV